MAYITRETEITVLPLSVRLSNCLRRAEIHTIGAFLDYPEHDEWLSIRNMGVKSAEEADFWREAILSGKGEFVLSGYECTACEDSTQYIPLDVKLSDLHMPTRFLNLADMEGIETAAQLVVMPDEWVFSLKGISEASCSYALDLLKERIDETLNVFRQSPERVDPSQHFALQLTDEIANGLHCDTRCVLRTVVLVRRDHPKAQGETFYYYLYESPVLRKALKETILALLEKSSDGLSKKRLDDSLLQHLRNTTITDEALIELENEQCITMDEHMIRRRYPSVFRWIRQIEDEKIQKMIIARLHGQTLDEVGQQHNITRERVRQITQKYLTKWQKQGQRFQEDEYLKWFDQYAFTKENFTFVFNVPDTTYHYLDVRSSVNRTDKKNLSEILDDETAPVGVRKQCERVAFRDYIMLDGIRVKKDRAELCYHYVKHHCCELTAYDDFMQGYHEFLREADLQDQPSLIIEARTYENKLNAADYVLWNQWRRFRYYNIKTRDYTELVDTLNFQQYENTEISSLKLFREYPDLMKEYDIRDEYELHNLLKKIWPADDQTVVFRKMPTIEIGTINRNNQVLNLLLQYAPISGDDLAEKYEELYGIKAVTVRANYLKDFDEYYYEGIYSIEADNLPYEQFTYLKTNLTDDYYFIPNIKRLYLKAFPDGRSEDINPYTLKTLGFKVFSSYVIKDTYTGATEYFHNLLTDDDIVDTRTFDKSVYTLGSYSGELCKLRANRDIVEYAHYQYINIRRLQQFGAGKEQLDAYCMAVWDRVEPGDLFTVTSLRNNGFSHPLDDLGFEEWFYSSILLEDREHFSYQRIGGTRLFKAGQAADLMEDLLHMLVGRSGKMDIFDLRDCLEEDYGIVLPRDKVVELVRETDMYYDRIMEAVYIDYDTYFEEV